MLKKILLAAGAVVALLVVCVAALFGWFAYQMRDMKVAETGRISDSVFVVNSGMTNVYLAGKNGVFVAFDAGNNPGKVAAALASLSISPDAVRAVFLTHSDGDHVGGLPAFTKAAVYLSLDEEPLVKGVTPRHSLGITHFNKLPVKDHRVLGDGDSVDVGGIVVHAIATPGHTPGSMCYRVGDAIFIGDLCLLKNGVVEPMLKIFTEDMAGDSASIRKIARLTGVRVIGTAHTGYATDFAAAIAKWR